MGRTCNIFKLLCEILKHRPIGALQKKWSSLPISFRFYSFRPEILVFSKKKTSSPEISLLIFTLDTKTKVFSKKKGLRVGSASNFSNFIPNRHHFLIKLKNIYLIAQNFVMQSQQIWSCNA